VVYSRLSHSEGTESGAVVIIRRMRRSYLALPHKSRGHHGDAKTVLARDPQLAPRKP
jgi:hypothetical protein